MAEKKKRGPKTKADKLKEQLTEIEQAAKDYEKQNAQDDDLEFPPITLPCRGYFREMDYGDSVRNLQLAMNRIMLANIPVTCEYDAETMAAVELFEKKYGGCVNGRFGETELIAYNKIRGVK